MVEEFKDIPGYEGLYQVSNTGRVLNFKRNKFIALNNNHGYKHVNLWKNNKVKNCKVHRLVMLAFVGSSDLGVNHKDGDKTNNNLNNLEYVTQKENIRHSHKTGLAVIAKGKRLPQTKLTEKEVLEIKSLLKEGIYHKIIAEQYGVSREAITCINIGKNWKYL